MGDNSQCQGEFGLVVGYDGWLGMDGWDGWQDGQPESRCMDGNFWNASLPQLARVGPRTSCSSNSGCRSATRTAASWQMQGRFLIR